MSGPDKAPSLAEAVEKLLSNTNWRNRLPRCRRGDLRSLRAALAAHEERERAVAEVVHESKATEACAWDVLDPPIAEDIQAPEPGARYEYELALQGQVRRLSAALARLRELSP